MRKVLSSYFTLATRTLKKTSSWWCFVLIVFVEALSGHKQFSQLIVTNLRTENSPQARRHERLMGEKNDCCLNLANEVEALENCTGHRRGYILWLPVGGTSLWTSHSEWEMALHSHRRTACIVESPLPWSN